MITGVSAAASSPCEASVAMLHDIVGVGSVSGSEGACVRRLVGWMGRLGLRARIDEAGNAVGWVGSDPGPGTRDVVLLGHIDTVPGDIPVRIEGGVLHGRGAVDAKGALCAFVSGAAGVGLPPGVRVVVIGAVGEEADSPGARHVARAYQPAACIIGEPSGVDGVTLGYKGTLRVRAGFRVPCSHTSSPIPSAPELAAEWWQRVRALTDEHNRGLQGPFKSLQARLTRMGGMSDGLVDEAECEVRFRLPPGVEPGALEARVRGISGSTPDAPALRFAGAERAWVSDRSDPVCTALSRAIRAQGLTPRLKLKTGTSDMNVVGPAWRCPIAAYGPGDSGLDHTPREHVRIDEYEASIRVLRRALVDLCAFVVDGQASGVLPEGL